MTRKVRGVGKRRPRAWTEPASTERLAPPAPDPDDPEHRRIVTEAHEWLVDLRRRGYNVPADDPDAQIIERAFAELTAREGGGAT